MDFYVWGTTMLLGIGGSVFVTQLSPSQVYAKYVTFTFSLLNAAYWLYVYWSHSDVSEHLVYYSIATTMIILPLALISSFIFSKN